VADTGNGTVRKITSSGAVSTLAGSASNRGTQDGTGSAAYFQTPTGIAVDSTGNVYVSDTNSSTIRKVTSAGVVTTLAGSAPSLGESDGLGTYARFSSPTGLAINSSGGVMVADTNSDTVRVVGPDGTTSTLIGSAGISGSFDGQGYDALLNLPRGVHVASTTGYLYIADTANNLIRKSTTSGAVITVAGVAGISGLRNSASGLPLFNQPQGMVVDSSNNIFVVDTGNSVIRKVATDGTVTTLTPSATATTTTTVSGGGSGGGSFSSLFSGLLALLVAARGFTRRRA
jgi:sugar lactone lactonase YvrE